jgi:hypothetical protein
MLCCAHSVNPSVELRAATEAISFSRRVDEALLERMGVGLDGA